MDTAGALVGSLLAALLLWGLSGNRGDARSYRTIFVISAAMGVAAVALTFLIRESPRDKPIEKIETGTLALTSTYWMVLISLGPQRRSGSVPERRPSPLRSCRSSCAAPP